MLLTFKILIETATHHQQNCNNYSLFVRDRHTITCNSRERITRKKVLQVWTKRGELIRKFLRETSVKEAAFLKSKIALGLILGPVP